MQRSWALPTVLLLVLGSLPVAAMASNDADSLKRKLAGTRWVNSNQVSFEWTKDGRFLHNGVERDWKVLDGKRVQIIFRPDHKDTLIFNESLTGFKQLIRGGPGSFAGKRAGSPSEARSNPSKSQSPPATQRRNFEPEAKKSSPSLEGRRQAATGPRLVVRNRALHGIDARLFGTFLDRTCNDREKGSEAAVIPGTHQLQPKVVEMLRGLNAPIIRFPHGTHGDFTDWTDMIDDVPGRGPGRPDSVGHTGDRITSRFGYDEFLRMCEDFQTEPLLVLNFLDGLGGKKPIREAALHAAAQVAYCNAREGAKLPSGLQRWPKLRALNGRRQPFKVRYFQIGNEMWGQMDALKERWPAEYLQHYLTCLTEYVRAIKAVDPSVQVITDSHGPEVDVAVRRQLGDQISFLVEHFYAPREIKEFTRSGMRVPASEIPIRQLWNAYVTVSPIDASTGLSILPAPLLARAKTHGYPLAVTEWNWNGWWTGPPEGPPDLYLARGVGAAGVLHAMMRAGGVIRIACQSMAVGNSWAITSIRVDPAGKDEPYYLPTGQVVALYARHHGNTLLETVATGVDTFEQPLEFGQDGRSSMMLGGHASLNVAALDALATADRKAVFLHLINRDFDRPADLEVDLTAFKNLTGKGTQHTLAGRLKNQPGPGETRQLAHVERSEVRLEGTVLRLKLAARTVSCVELERRP